MKQLAFIVLILGISGCVTVPSVDRVPDVVLDSGPTNSAPRVEVERWWLELDDSVLHNLIEIGLAGNPSRQIAIARLAQAEAELGAAEAARWPSLFGRGNRQVRNISGRDPNIRSDLGSLDFGWDAGLWGKRRLEIEGAQQFAEQRWFEQQSVELALSASIAETYYQTVALRTQGALLAAQIQVSKDLERLIEARFRLGQAPANELYQQREQTTVLEQLKLVNDTRQEVLEKSLDVLLGQPPDAVARVVRLAVPDAPEALGPGTPEEHIRHRADIRAGYARLRQAAAGVGISFAERLPSLQVTASLTSLTEKTFSTEWFGYGLDLTVPIFTGGRLRQLEKRAQFVLEEERQRYLELWLAALEEVSSLTRQYQQQQRIIDTLAARRGHAQQALDAARNRYTLGDQNYLDVLTALRGLQEADRFLVSERFQLITLWIRATEAIGQPMCGDVEDCRGNWQL